MWGYVGMNDFTKEELQIIELDMNHNILKEKILNVASSYIALRDKVELMIDNYCAHEACGEQEIFVDICNKCNGVMVRND